MENGSKIAQACHACFEFAWQHHDTTLEWMQSSNTIVILETSQAKLAKTLVKSKELKIRHSIFVEPDLNDLMTAIVLEPGELTKKLCRGFRLAGS